MKNRMVAQDIAKGLAVIVVLWFHAAARLSSFTLYPLIPFAYVMAFYFIISGYNYKSGRRSIGQSIWLRFKQLLIPLLIYCVLSTIVTLCVSLPNGYSFKQNMYGFLSSLFMDPTLKALRIDVAFGVENAFRYAPSSIASWFVWYMFFGYCLFYCVADFILEKSYRFFISIPALVGLTVLLVWLLDGVNVPFNIHYTPLVVAFLLTGSYFKKTMVFEENKIPLVWNIVICVILAAACTTTYLLKVNVNGSVKTGIGRFAGGTAIMALGIVEIPITFALGVACTYYFINFCRLLAKVKFLQKPLSFLGENSLGIYLFQFCILSALGTLFNLGVAPTGQEPAIWEIVLKFFITFAISTIVSYFTGKLIKLMLSPKQKKEEVKNDQSC